MGKLWTAYKLRLRRQRLLLRAFRKRWQLTVVSDKTDLIANNTILAFSTVRNEILRLPYFLDYYRKLGVGHFLFVENNSDDGTREYLAKQPDVSVWTTGHSYKLARFGADWLTWLLIKHGHGHWCLTVDADEILVYPYCDQRPLRELTKWLETGSIPAFGALMLDMYPKGPLSAQTYQSGQDPFETLRWFDSDNYRCQKQKPLQNLWVQGGVRDRVFFQEKPERAPTLNKLPLVKWNRRYTYVNSTHSLLPCHLNLAYEFKGANKTTGVLLHSKFLPVVVDKSREEKQRQEHFNNSSLYDEYYDRLSRDPDLWCEQSSEYSGWKQLVQMQIMSNGKWR